MAKTTKTPIKALKGAAVCACCCFIALSLLARLIGELIGAPFYKALAWLDPQIFGENEKCDSDFM